MYLTVRIAHQRRERRLDKIDAKALGKGQAVAAEYGAVRRERIEVLFVAQVLGGHVGAVPEFPDVARAAVAAEGEDAARVEHDGGGGQHVLRQWISFAPSKIELSARSTALVLSSLPVLACGHLVLPPSRNCGRPHLLQLSPKAPSTGAGMVSTPFNIINNAAGAGILTLSAGMAAGVGWCRRR